LRSDPSPQSLLTEEFVRGFAVFDPEQTGSIGVGQLRYILTNLGEKLSDQEVDELLAGAKVGSDGNIDYRTFVREVRTSLTPTRHRRDVAYQPAYRLIYLLQIMAA
jgi:Ca2+-binding EF-hand superfamily protein